MDINEVRGKDCISIDLSYPSCIDNLTGLKPSLIHRCTQSALAGRMISETWLKLLGWLWESFFQASVLMMQMSLSNQMTQLMPAFFSSYA